MAIKLFEQIKQEITEAQKATWNIKDCMPVQVPKPGKKSSQQSKGGQSVKEIGKPVNKKGSESDGKDNKSAGSGNSGDKQKNKNKSISSGTSDKNSKKEWMDDHSKIKKSDNTAKGIIEKAYKEVEADYRAKAIKGIGQGEGNLSEKIKNYLKADFDVSKILARIGTFKRKLSKYFKKHDTYVASAFNPVTRQSTVTMKGRVKETLKEKKSAMLIMAVDTSGSISEEDFKTVFGYLQDISKKFEKQEHGINGETFYISWDTAVHPPLKEFKT
jgi:hypothetical protein